MLNSIKDCFVTGKWDEDQDAATMLKEDGKRGRRKSQLGQLYYNKIFRFMFEEKISTIINDSEHLVLFNGKGKTLNICRDGGHESSLK